MDIYLRCWIKLKYKTNMNTNDTTSKSNICTKLFENLYLVQIMLFILKLKFLELTQVTGEMPKWLETLCTLYQKHLTMACR